jgi:hypothetical protein
VQGRAHMQRRKKRGERRKCRRCKSRPATFFTPGSRGQHVEGADNHEFCDGCFADLAARAARNAGIAVRR